MLFARDVLDAQSRRDDHLRRQVHRPPAPLILQHGGSPLMWKTGHSLIKAKMKETDAELAGEMSGHFFFKERWYGFDDGIYAAARLLEILASDVEGRTPQQMFDDAAEGRVRRRNSRSDARRRALPLHRAASARRRSSTARA